MNAALGLVTIAALLGSGPGVGDPAAPPESSVVEPVDRGGRVGGVITSLADSGFALDTPNGEVTVVTSERTRFRIPGVEDPSLEDLAVGDHVIALGRQNEGGLFHAVLVARLRPDATAAVGGQITALGDNNVTLRTERGSVTIYVDRETGYTVRGVEEATFNDLEVGMNAIARVVLQEDGTILARHIAATATQPRPIRLRGEVTAISGRLFTLHTGEGKEIDVLTDDNTEFRIAGIENPTIADLNVGDGIIGRALVQQDGTLLATHVVVVPEQAARVYGEVVGIEDRTLVLDSESGRVRVLTDGDTVYRIPGITDPSFEDIEVGNMVLAVGRWQDEGAFQAAGIAVRRRPLPNTIGGRAISIGSDHLILETSQGQVRVLVTDETRYYVRGVRDPGLEDILPGALVRATGEWTGDLVFTATGVAAANPGISDAASVEAGLLESSPTEDVPIR